MKRYYLILSEGAYSAYYPIYFVGDREITQEEFDVKSREIGDSVIKEWEELPTREHTCGKYCYHSSSESMPYTEKYDPNNKERYVYKNPNAGDWFNLMEKWVLSQGFEKLPDNIPEINTSYSDFPNNLTKN